MNAFKHSDRYYMRDPQTGLYWDGVAPGRFTEKAVVYWRDLASAERAYKDYLLYTNGRKVNTSPPVLDVVHYEVKVHEGAVVPLKPVLQASCLLVAAIKKEFTGTTIRQAEAMLLRMASSGRIHAAFKLALGETGIAKRCNNLGPGVHHQSYYNEHWLGAETLVDVIKIKAEFKIKRAVDLYDFVERMKSGPLAGVWTDAETACA